MTEKVFYGEEVQTGRLVVFFDGRSEGQILADKFFQLCDGIVPGIQRIVTNRGEHGVASKESGNHRNSNLWLEAGEICLGTPVHFPRNIVTRPLRTFNETPSPAFGAAHLQGP